MKKIMFNDKYGLTKAVLEGRKTMTRRAIKKMTGWKSLLTLNRSNGGAVYFSDGSFLVFKDALDLEPIILYPKYKVGEVVAVAQSYKDIREEWGESGVSPFVAKAGYRNKMYVRADLMPHQICITNVRVERLQNISDEDCIREGIKEVPFTQYSWTDNEKMALFDTPRDAFAALIDKVSGKGTWESNPWVYVYEFEFVK